MKMSHTGPSRRIHGAILNRAIILSLGVALLSPAAFERAWAQSSTPADLMSYQGYLVDVGGSPLASTNPVNFRVVFRIYASSSGGNSLWTESQAVTVDKGAFSVVLGEGVQEGSEPRPSLSSVFASNTASDRYVGITVKGLTGGDPEITPRLRLLPGPYAFLARSANGLVAPDGTALLTPDAGRLRLSQAIQSTGGNARGDGAVDLQVLRQPSQPAQVASGKASAVLGGQNNTASGESAVVSGGNGNIASALGASALGGDRNTASGQYSTAVGGRQNTASGEYSMAAGRRANAGHAGSFVWADGTDAEFASTAANQFNIRATGGVGINTAAQSGVALKVNGTVTATKLEVDSLTVKNATAASEGAGSVPVGGIIMWSGSAANVPKGWALCDGSKGTPDLRDRFILGSSGTRSAGSTGGANTITLTTDNLPAHNHVAKGSVSEGGEHKHKFRSFRARLEDNSGDTDNSSTKDEKKGELTDDNAVQAAGKHTHTFDVTTTSVGGGKAVSFMPSYYAMAFIMRVQN